MARPRTLACMLIFLLGGALAVGEPRLLALAVSQAAVADERPLADQGEAAVCATTFDVGNGTRLLYRSAPARGAHVQRLTITTRGVTLGVTGGHAFRDAVAMASYRQQFPRSPFESRDHLSNHEIARLSHKLQILSHGAATEILPATYDYNCHGYTLRQVLEANMGTTIALGWVSGRALEEFLDKRFDRVASPDDAQPGDVVYWGARVDHSGVVVDVARMDGGTRLFMTSKWSELGVFVHDLEFNPYQAAGADLGSARFYRFSPRKMGAVRIESARESCMVICDTRLEADPDATDADLPRKSGQGAPAGRLAGLTFMALAGVIATGRKRLDPLRT